MEDEWRINGQSGGFHRRFHAEFAPNRRGIVAMKRKIQQTREGQPLLVSNRLSPHRIHITAARTLC